MISHHPYLYVLLPLAFCWLFIDDIELMRFWFHEILVFLYESLSFLLCFVISEKFSLFFYISITHGPLSNLFSPFFCVLLFLLSISHKYVSSMWICDSGSFCYLWYWYGYSRYCCSFYYYYCWLLVCHVICQLYE